MRDSCCCSRPNMIESSHTYRHHPQKSLSINRICSESFPTPRTPEGNLCGKTSNKQCSACSRKQLAALCGRSHLCRVAQLDVTPAVTHFSLGYVSSTLRIEAPPQYPHRTQVEKSRGGRPGTFVLPNLVPWMNAFSVDLFAAVTTFPVSARAWRVGTICTTCSSPWSFTTRGTCDRSWCRAPRRSVSVTPVAPVKTRPSGRCGSNQMSASVGLPP